MKRPKLKILCNLTISLMLLLAPMALKIGSGGEAHALGSSGDKSIFDRSSTRRVPRDYHFSKHEKKQEVKESLPSSGAPSPVPEPATWLLVGAGAAGVAAFKKRFKKK